jgi:hypothetical protein
MNFCLKNRKIIPVAHYGYSIAEEGSDHKMRRKDMAIRL